MIDSGPTSCEPIIFYPDGLEMEANDEPGKEKGLTGGSLVVGAGAGESKEVIRLEAESPMSRVSWIGIDEGSNFEEFVDSPIVVLGIGALG